MAACVSGKIGHTKGQAQTVLRRMKARGVIDGHTLRAYRCRSCDWWHLGNATAGQRTWIRVQNHASAQ